MTENAQASGEYKSKKKGGPELQKILLQHGVTSLVGLVFCIEKLFVLDPKAPTDKTALIAEGGAAEIISDICSHLASASKILFDAGEKRPRESREIYKLRLERVKLVQTKCAEIELGPLTSTKARDRIVHLDERLAATFLREPYASWIIDVALSSRKNITSAPEHPLRYSRVYVFDEEKILHLDTEIDLRALHSSAVAVLNKIVADNWREDRLRRFGI